MPAGQVCSTMYTVWLFGGKISRKPLPTHSFYFSQYLYRELFLNIVLFIHNSSFSFMYKIGSVINTNTANVAPGV